MSSKYIIKQAYLGFVSENMCPMTVLRGHTNFQLAVDFAAVKGTDFGTELMQKVKVWQGLPRGRARDKLLLDLIHQRCLSHFEKLAPQTLLHDISLESFLRSPHYNLELFREDTKAGVCIRGEDMCSYRPAFFTAPMRIADLPESCRAVPHFHARDIFIAPMVKDGKSIEQIQGRVVTVEGSPFYFKPRIDMRRLEFERELHVLSRIDEAGLTARIKVPKLQGIVVSGEETMGMLMTMVNSSEIGSHLRSPGLWDRQELHKKWEEQLTNTVQELHAHGIVWGDVHPMNMLIDEKMDAWAIDFGGMNNAEFVDRENRETMKGDWQGLTRTFQEWLPNPQRRSMW